MKLEILNEAGKGMLAKPLCPHEELYYPTVVGASLHRFEAQVLRARIRFMNRAGRDHLCWIEVETSGGLVTCEGGGSSRSAAFLEATEHLDRRLFESLYRNSGLDDSFGGPTRIAA